MRRFILGILVGGFASYYWFVARPTSEKIYTVQSIKSHTSQKNANSKTHIVIYLQGESGHVKELFCEFPPDLKLEGSETSGWSGLNRVKVKGEATRKPGGETSYYCENVE
ncbi:MAG: hypothetical protein EXS64_10315 [Candidatus Latescibacteria bacterium]|nr:hypothetical protein [Candidatus Latescibacterota bacterium]